MVVSYAVTNVDGKSSGFLAQVSISDAGTLCLTYGFTTSDAYLFATNITPLITFVQLACIIILLSHF